MHTIKRKLFKIGMSTAETPFGNVINVYDMERTVCDIIRNRKRVEAQTLKDALTHYSRHSDKHIGRLMQYARLFQVERILNTYLEVLL